MQTTAPISTPVSAVDTSTAIASSAIATSAPHVEPNIPKKTTMLRVASQDVVLNSMEIPGGREYLKDSSKRALSFQNHKEKFREYALKRYHELQRFRREENARTDL